MTGCRLSVAVCLIVQLWRLDVQLDDINCFAYALTLCVVWQAASENPKDASVQARQVQAEEEARLALLADQAGMKLTLTEQVPVLFLAAHVCLIC